MEKVSIIINFLFFMEENKMFESSGEYSENKSIFSKLITKKYIGIVAFIAVFGALGYYGKGLVVAALVNGSPISRWSVLKESEKQTGKKVLDFLIVKQLIEHEARVKGVTITDEEINGEVKKIEAGLVSQGQTLAAILKAQNMSEKDLHDQLALQKELEKLVADKVTVTDADVEDYIKKNKITLPAGVDQNAEKGKIKESLANGKRSQDMQHFVEQLRAGASIKYFVQY